MPDYNAGDAKLRIIPDASNFKKDLEADMRRINAEYAVQIKADLDKAKREMEVWRKEQQANSVHVPVEVDTKRVEKAGKDAGNTFSNAFSKAFSGGLTSPAALFGGASLLPALSLGLGEVTAAMQQLAQAGLLLPGVFASLGASVGTAKLGLSGVDEAFKAVAKSSSGSAKDLQAANDALKKLAPNAQDFVTSVSALKPKFDELKSIAQNNLFANLSTDVKNLVAKDFPAFQKGIDSISKGLNQNLRQALQSLSTDGSKNILDRILGNTGEAQSRITKAIDPLVRAFGTLAAAGTDALPGLADGMGKLAERFDRFISAADKDGRLGEWIQQGITGFGKLGESLLNIGKVFTAITKAVGGGDGLLGMLESATGKLATFLNSARGQNDLKEFFAKGGEQLRQLRDIAVEAGPILSQLFTGAINSSKIWLPVIKDVLDIINAIPGGADAVVGAFVAWKSITAAADLVKSLESVANFLKFVIPGAAGVAEGSLAGLAAVLGPIAAAIGAISAGKYLADATDATPELHDKLVHDQGSRGRFSPPSRSPKNNALIPGGGAAGAQRERRGYATGGPVVGTGPALVHDNEYVISSRGRSSVSDATLAALNAGHFAGGGFIDPTGNPVTAGTAPGPGAGGGFMSSLMSGISNPIGNLMGMGQQQSGGQQAGGFSNRLAAVPGLIGLAGVFGGSNPEGDLTSWVNQTGNWLGNFGAKTASGFGGSLYQGGLNAVGLGNSILSPTNPYNQGIQQALGFGANIGNNGNVTSSSSSSGSDSGSVTISGNSTDANGMQHLGQDRGGISWKLFDAIAKDQFSLTMTSGYRSPNGPKVAGVAANKSYHASGRAHDFIGSETQMIAFANFMAANYGPQLKELIFDAPGFSSTINNGNVVGPFGAFYTMAQAGDHRNHVHIAFAGGGKVTGPGTGTSDSVPAWLSAGEHVLTAADVQAMGGQENVMAFRSALHRAYGGPIPEAAVVPKPKPVPAQTKNMPPPPKPVTPQQPPPGVVSMRPAPAQPAPATPPVPTQTPEMAAPAQTAQTDQPKDDTAKPVGQGGGGAAPTSTSHNLSAVSTGIESGFSAVGNIVSAAIQAGEAGASMGAGAAGGGMGGASASSLVSGLFSQAGKIADAAVNVGSSFLVGNVTGGTQDSAYGQTFRPQQVQPSVAQTRGGPIYNVNAVQIPEAMRELRLKEAQDQQSMLAHH